MPATQVELSPFELDEYLLWEFRRGLGGRDAVWDAVSRALDEPGARRAFTTGMLKGASTGAYERLDEEIAGTLELVQSSINWTLEGYTTLYDPVLLLRGLLAWGATPGTPEFEEAVATFGAEFRIRHPALSGAVEALAEATTALRALADWLKQPNALREVLGAVASDFGDLIGDFWDEVASRRGQPSAQGEVVGDAIGRVCMEVALFILDI